MFERHKTQDVTVFFVLPGLRPEPAITLGWNPELRGESPLRPVSSGNSERTLRLIQNVTASAGRCVSRITS